MQITKPSPASNHLADTQAKGSGNALSGDICPWYIVVHPVYSSFKQTRKKQHPKNHRSRNRRVEGGNRDGRRGGKGKVKPSPGEADFEYNKEVGLSTASRRTIREWNMGYKGV